MKELLLLGTHSNYSNKLQDIVDFTTTVYSLAKFDSIIDSLALPQAIQNFNTNLGTESGIEFDKVTSYLKAALDYHSAVMFYKKVYDRNNRVVGNKIAKWKDAQVIRPTLNQTVEFPIPNDYNIHNVEDVKLFDLNPAVYSNAKWSNQVLEKYNNIYLPTSMYMLASYLFSNVFKNSDNSKLYEFTPLGTSTSTRDVEDTLNSLYSLMVVAINSSPYFTEFLKFIGFVNVPTDAFVLDRAGVTVQYIVDGDLDFAVVNTVHNYLTGENAEFLPIQFSTNNVLFEGVNDSHINVELSTLSNVLLFIKSQINIGGVYMMCNGEWLDRSTFNTTTNSFKNIAVPTAHIRITNSAIYGDPNLSIAFAMAGSKSDFYHFLSHKLFERNSPQTSFEIMPDNVTLEIRTDLFTKVGNIENFEYGNNEVYIFNIEDDVYVTLANLLFYGVDNFPTVYIPGYQLNENK